MILPAAGRKLVLAVHLTSSVGWVGAVAAYLPLALTAETSSDAATIRAAWTAMELIGWAVLVPLAVTATVTGVVLAAVTRWRLLDHYWVVISLGTTTAAAIVLVLHMPDVSAAADRAARISDAELEAMGGDVPHTAAALVVLLAVLALNVYKPRGLTRRGWRRRHDVARREVTV